MPGNEANRARDVPCHPEEEMVTVGPLLARANLLRMRGQWDEAVAVCTEALRRIPESPTACSLLGDIYEAQGKLDDAMQWYGMAVEFDPNNKSDRDKLDQIVRIQRRALLQEEKEARARALQTVAKRADPAHRTLEWFDRIFPPGKEESIARLILLIGGAIFLLVMSTAAFVYLGNITEARTSGALTGPPPSPDTVVVQPPVSSLRTPPITPAPDVPTPGARPAGLPPRPRSLPARSAGGAHEGHVPSLGPGDTALLEDIARDAPAGAIVTAAQVDPRSAQVMLAITLPAFPGANGASETPGATRERILRAAARIARAATRAAPSLERVSLRVSLRPVAGTGATPPAQLAFVGDIATAAVRAADPTTSSGPSLIALFTNPWWSNALDPGPPPA